MSGVDLRLGYPGTSVVTCRHIAITERTVTALVGPNGSGKSTLLRTLARLHRADSGGVLLDEGLPAMSLSSKAFARRVTLLAQSRPTPAGVCVRDMVEHGRHPHRTWWHDADPDGARAVGWAMEVTGVTAMATAARRRGSPDRRLRATSPG